MTISLLKHPSIQSFNHSSTDTFILPSDAFHHACINSFPQRFHHSSLPAAITDTKNSRQQDFAVKYSCIRHLATSIRLFPNQSDAPSRLALFFIGQHDHPDFEDVYIDSYDDVIGRLCRSAVNSHNRFYGQVFCLMGCLSG